MTLFMTSCAKQEEPLKTSDAAPLLLKVTKDGDENEMYLFGSIHAADETLYPLSDTVIESFKKSDYVAVEFDLIEEMKDLEGQIEMLSDFVYKEGKMITDDLDKENYDRAVEMLKNAGLYNSLYENYIPIMWQSLIETAAIVDSGLEERHGIDRHILSLAKDEEKEIIELESAKYQYDILKSFDKKTQINLLKSSIEEYDSSIDNLKQLYELYKRGNRSDLEKNLFKEETDDEYQAIYNKKLITQRNEKMAERLDLEFKNGKKIFCTVGLAHIIGEGGIADILSKKGYIITVQ